MDWQALGTAAAAVGAVAGGMWAWWLKNQKTQAQTRADVAEADTERTVADAQRTVYGLLTERVATLESEVRSMRQELADERAHNRQLVLHIWQLESLMRKAGIPVPAFDAGPVRAAVAR